MKGTKEKTAEYRFTGDLEKGNILAIHNGTSLKNKVVIEISTVHKEPLMFISDVGQLFIMSHLITGAINADKDMEARITGTNGEVIPVTYARNPGLTDWVLTVGPLVTATQSETLDIASLFYMAPEVVAQ